MNIEMNGLNQMYYMNGLANITLSNIRILQERSRDNSRKTISLGCSSKERV